MLILVVVQNHTKDSHVMIFCVPQQWWIPSFTTSKMTSIKLYNHDKTVWGGGEYDSVEWTT